MISFMRVPSKPLALIVFAGAVLLLSQGAHAQRPQYNCRPDDAGTGWVCGNLTTDDPLPGIDRDGNGDSGPEPEEEPDEEPEEQSAAPTPSPEPESDPAAILYRPPAQEFDYDWRPLEALSEAQRAAVRPHCCGLFVDPLAGQVDPDADPEQAPTQFVTPAGLSQPGSDRIAIDGDIVVRQGYRILTNDGSTTIDRGAETLSLAGDVRLREPGLLLAGDSAFIDGANRVNSLSNARYVLHDYGVHGNAASVTYDGEAGLITIDNGEFSRCEPAQEFWQLRAARITLDPARRRGYAEDVSLRVADIPLFYYPFTLAFPLGDERISGFLAPSLGSTRTGGLDIELPYYFNIAPQADATLAPRLVSDRGLMLGAEFRYLASWSMNTVNAAFLGDDDLYDPATAGAPASESPPVPDRWFLGYEHQGALGPLFSTYVDYNAVSDSDYFYDLGGSGLNVASQTHLNRQGRLDFHSPLLRAGLNVQRIQVIDPIAQSVDLNKPYDKLPEFSFASEAFLGAGFEAEIRGQVTSFDRELEVAALSMEQIDDGALVNGERINLEPALRWAAETPGWFLRAAAEYRHMAFRLDRQAEGTAAEPEVSVPVYSLDGGLVFERDRRGGGTQTLEPRVYYLYSEFEDQSTLPLFDTSELNFSFNQLFRDERFAGGDRIGDADQVTVALTSRLLDDDGVERARLSLGQIHYFEDRRVSLGNPLRNFQPRYALDSEQSALAGEVELRLGSDWRLSSDLQWNEERGEADEGSFQLRYQAASDRLFNAAYRYRRLVNSPFFTLPPGVDPRIKQTDVSGVWPLNETWTLLGRWNYDLSNERNLESFAGVEWQNCCATIRLIGREWVDENELFVPNSEPNRGIFVQFTLHGLGNIAGGGLSSLLEDGIRGFRESEYE